MKTLNFDDIYEEYFHEIYRYIFYMVSDKQLAEDLTQEVFLRIYKSNSKPQTIATYVRQVARHLVIDYYRKKSLIQWLPFGKDDEQHAHSYIPHDWLVQSEEHQQLFEALQKLKPLQREILIYRKIDELSIEETNQITGLSTTKIANTQRSAMKKLQQILGGNWMIDRQLKKLKDLPENQAAKERIKQTIKAKQATSSFARWKLPSLLVAICSIALFLMFTSPNMSLSTASSSEKAIYTYFGGDEGTFKARASLLYTNTQKVKSEREIAYLENIESLETIADGKLGAYIVDVVFVSDGKQHRYQLSNMDIYDVDRNIYYRDTSDVYSEVFHTLYAPKVSSFTLLLPLIILIVIMYSMYYYKRLGISQKELMPKTASFYLIIVTMFTVLIGSILYTVFVAPVFIPLLIIICLVYTLFIWRYFTRHIQNIRALQFERIKLIILMIVIILLFFFII